MLLQLIFIRHGATTGSKEEHRFLGITANPPLSERGKRELMQKKKQGVYPYVDALYISPLKCCVETAPLLYPMLVPVALNFLSERDYGSFEGKTYEQLKNDPAYRLFTDTDGKTTPPGGESAEDFSERLKAAVQYIAEDAQRLKIRKAAVITHDGCILNLMAQFYLSAKSKLNLADFLAGDRNGFKAEIDTSSLSFLSVEPF